jgi:hypothetical protein
VEFTATETTANRAVGLNRGSTGVGYTEIDYAIYFTSGGVVSVYESGTFRGSFGSYASGDRFRVEVAYGAVRYRKNGAVFYSSTVAPQFPLLADASIDTSNGTVTGARMGSLTWARDVGLSVAGTTLTKTGAAGWNAGAVSASSIARRRVRGVHGHRDGQGTRADSATAMTRIRRTSISASN